LNLNLNLKNNDSIISEAKNGLPKINEKTFFKAALEYSLG
jgi:hypothetical protein